MDTATVRQHEPVSELGSNIPPWFLLQFLLAVLYITYVKTGSGFSSTFTICPHGIA